jgi:predicted AlkP superfamily phosphohydrolase/phosphomutase
LSNFAGIKSYPHGGIEINRELVSEDEYEELRSTLIVSLSELRSPHQEPLMEFVKAREDVDFGRFCADMYPDILFWLADGYGVGWELYSSLYGKAHDHKVASGGHSKEAVLLLRNIDREIRDGEMSIINVAPSILDLFEIDWHALDLDGESMFES